MGCWEARPGGPGWAPSQHTVTAQLPLPGSEARGLVAQREKAPAEGLLCVDSQGDLGGRGSGTGPMGNGSRVLARSLVALPLV